MKRPRFFGFRRAFTLVLLLAVAAGCGRKTAPVRGKVTYQGTPLTMGNVIILSEDGHFSARGVIQPDGTYEIAQAPTGKVKVGVSNPPPAGVAGGQPLGPRDNPETKQAAALAAKYVPSPDTYTDPEKSGLAYDVPTKGTTIDLDLKGSLPTGTKRGGGGHSLD